MLSLVNNVLEMARIESGKMTVDTKPFDAGKLYVAIHEVLQK